MLPTPYYGPVAQLINVMINLFHLYLAHGNWGAWTEVTQCTKTCGGGAQTKTRTCDSPAPGKNGQACMLSTGSGRAMEETVTNALCNTQACDGE